MKLTRKVRQQIIKSIKEFIPINAEFFSILNNNCIIYGKYLLQFINIDHNEENNVIEMLADANNFVCLHHLLSDNNFSVVNFNNSTIELDISNMSRLTTNTIWYEKSIGDITIHIHVVKTPNIYTYLNTNIKLKIEQCHFNGGLVVLPYAKEIHSKYEINDRIKITDPKMCKKLLYYSKQGYSFEIMSNNEKIIIRPHKFNRFKYYISKFKY